MVIRVVGFLSKILLKKCSRIGEIGVWKTMGDVKICSNVSRTDEPLKGASPKMNMYKTMPSAQMSIGRPA